MSLRIQKYLVLMLCTMALGLFSCAKKEKPTYTPPEPRREEPRVERRVSTATDGRTTLAFPTGYRESSVLLLEVESPTELRIGQGFEYRVTATNIAENLTLRNVTIIEETPGNFAIQSSDPTGQGGLTAMRDRAGTTLRSYYIGSLDPGESRTLTVTASVNSEESILACLTADYDLFLCWEAQVINPQIRVEKTGPAQVLLCDPINYTVKITNTGKGTANNVVVLENLPQGLTSDGKSSLRFEVGDLAEGQSETFNIAAQATAAGTYVNQAMGRSDALEAMSNPVSTTVLAPQLAITKTAPARDYIQVPFRYEIVVTNSGNGEARDVVVRDQLPANVEFESATQGGTKQGDSVVWNVGTLAPNQSTTLGVTVVGTALGRADNVVTAEGVCAPEVRAQATTELVGIPGLLLEVVDEKDPIRVGEVETYNISVTNQGSATATNVRIIAILENSTYISSDGPTPAQAQANTITFAPLASLAPKDTAVWQLRARADAPGDVRFRVEMIADQLSRPVRETESTTLYDAGSIGQQTAPRADDNWGNN